MTGQPTGGRALQQASRAQKRDLILHEAVRLFNEFGYFDTRLEDVAQRLDASKTSISYHFRTKEALLGEAYAAACDFAESEIAVAATAPTGLERVVRWIRAFANAQALALTGTRPPIALVTDVSALGEDHRRDIAARFSRHAGAIATFLREGIDDGSVAVRSPEGAAFLVISVQHWLRRWLSMMPPADYDAAIDSLISLLTFGIAADPARPPLSERSLASRPDTEVSFNREARNAFRKEAFLRTGTRFLNARGYRNLSVHEVAAALGVTRGAFYYYVEDKDALIVNCFARTFDLVDRAIDAASDGTEDAVSALEAAFSTLFTGHVSDLDPLLRLSLLPSLSAAERAVAQARYRKVGARIGELVAKGMIDGSIRPFEAESAEQLLLGTVFAASHQRLSLCALSPAAGTGSNSISPSAFFAPLFDGLASPAAR